MVRLTRHEDVLIAPPARDEYSASDSSKPNVMPQQ